MLSTNNYTFRKFIFGLISFAAVFFTEAAFVVATSRFLSGGLIDQLPLLLLLVCVAAIINFGINIVLSKRFSALGSLIVSVLIIMGFTAVVFYLNFAQSIFLFATLLVTRFASIVFDTSMNNLSASYVNQRQAKAFLPMIRGSMDIAILGASAFVFLATMWEFDLEPLWLVMISAVLVVIGLLVVHNLFDPLGVDDKVPAISFREQFKNSMSFVLRRSKLYRLFALLFLVFGGIIVFFVYVYNSVFAANLSGLELTRFLAVANFTAVLIRSVFNFRFLQSAITRFGVANLLLLYPWGMFLLTFMVMLFSRNLYLAAALFVFHTFSFYSYVTVAAQSMFGLVPKRIGQQVFFFIKGFLPSVAALIMSFVMAAMLMFCSNNPISVSFTLFVLVSLTFVITLRIKKQYQAALLKSLGQDDLYLKTNAVELMGENVQVEQGERVLRQMLLSTEEDVVLRQKVLTSLVEINNPNSIRELLFIVEKDKNMRLRFYALQAINRMFERMNKRRFGNMMVTKLLLIDVINKIYEEDLPLPIKLEANKVLPLFGFEVLLEFYKTHFANSPDYVKASIIEAMAVSSDRGLITLLEPYLSHENLCIRAAAIQALWPFEEMRESLMGLVIEILAGKDELHRMVALQLISRLKLKKMDDYVLDLIAVPSKDLSTMAVITAITLGRKSAVKVLIRKLSKYAMLGDTVMVEFVFRKIMVLSGHDKVCVVNEIRRLGAVSFDRLREIFNQSNLFLDLSLAELFTS